MPGTVLGSGDMRGKETRSLTSCRLPSGVGGDNRGGEVDSEQYLVSCRVVIRANRKWATGQVTKHAWFRNGGQDLSEEVKLDLKKVRQEPCEYAREETSRQGE